MMRTLREWWVLVVAGSLLLACGGADDNEPTGTDAETRAETREDVVPGDSTRETGDALAETDESRGKPGESTYSLTLLLEPGPGITCAAEERQPCLDGASCCVYQFDQDLTGLSTKFAFGSTHIAPAVALAMTDTLYTPTFTVITLNFGIIIGTSDKPPATPKSGEYMFSGFEPEVTITIYSKVYSSKEEGASGSFTITDWTAEEAGLWAGSLAGTIVQVTDKETKLRGEVSAAFSFILPAPAGGQQGG